MNYIKYCKSLTNVEIVLLEALQEILDEKKKYLDIVIECAKSDYKKTIEAAQRVSLLSNSVVFNHLKNKLWECAEIKTLEKIYLGEPFEGAYTNFNISKEVLPKFSAFSKIQSSDPRSELAKQMGATIVDSSF